jgi:hypothetical protein
MGSERWRASVRTATGLALVLALAILGMAVGPPSGSQIETERPNGSVAEWGPITIDHGGTYRGKWHSGDAETPAVTIRTAEPVLIEDSELSGRGHLIATEGQHANITVRRCVGRGANPDVPDRCPGRFLNAEYFDNVVLENNDLEGTSGIYLLNYRGNFTAAETVRVVANRARNIDGRKSDGRGGFLGFNKRVHRRNGSSESGFRIVQFLQLDKVQNVPGMEVAWNEVINEPGKSRVEDNLNIYKSSGTAASPLRIHDNYIQGAFTIQPWQGNTSDSTWDYDWGYSGGGLMLGDGPADTPSQAAGFVVAVDNQVVATTNHGIAIAAGHDIEFSRNRVVSSGRLPDGQVIPAQNVGAYIWDLYHGGRSGTFFKNGGSANLIGWIKAGSRNDWWMPDASSWADNIPWPDTPSLATEATELALWKKKLAAAKITVGSKAD